VCELAYEYLLPEEGGYGSKFPDILKDEIRMSTIFENFVRNFYRLEQRKFKVSRDVIYWDAAADDPSHSTFLPVMLTDVSLRSANNTIIIDTKFYAKALVEYMGGTKVWSTHLYQLYAYLRNLESRPGPDRFAEGVLLYPVVDQILDLRYNIAAHSVRVATIDLNSDWRTIHTRLLGIIGI
jgi:5-methylcytosine-specific restriction enzyme subunit McrC